MVAVVGSTSWEEDEDRKDLRRRRRSRRGMMMRKEEEEEEEEEQQVSPWLLVVLLRPNTVVDKRLLWVGTRYTIHLLPEILARLWPVGLASFFSSSLPYLLARL